MKITKLIIMLLLASMAFGCAAEESEKMPGEPRDEANIIIENREEDVEVKAYKATDEKTLEEGLKNYYAVTILNDIESEKDLILEGEFSKTDTSIEDKVVGTGRILQLCEVDENGVVVGEYTLTTNRITIKSEKTILKGGKFVGDIYVNADQFTLSDVEVEGSIFFTNEKFKNTFKIESDSTVSGSIEVI